MNAQANPKVQLYKRHNYSSIITSTIKTSSSMSKYSIVVVIVVCSNTSRTITMQDATVEPSQFMNYHEL